MTGVAEPIAPRVVLFDAVGTLLFANPPVADAYQTIGNRHGSRRSRGEIADRFSAALASHRDTGPTDESREWSRWQSIVQAVFDDVPAASGALFRELWDHFADPRSWSLFADVEVVWKSLERRGVKLGIASNFDARLSRLCRAIPPLDRAAHLFCSSTLGFSKPQVDFFLAAQQQLGVAPHEIWLVGDDPIADYEGVLASGWNALLLDRSLHASVLPKINSLSQLLELLD